MEAFELWAADAFGKFYIYLFIVKIHHIYIDDNEDDKKDNKSANEEVKRKKGKRKDLWELKVDKDGNPMLPTLDICPKREELKSLIRSMATTAYSKYFLNIIEHTINHSHRETFWESPLISAMGFTPEKSRGIDRSPILAKINSHSGSITHEAEASQ
jgi:hypothetical protein